MTPETLITELEAIAKKNRDEFQYHIGIRPTRDGGFEYSFVCEESADRHTILVGYGSSIEECVTDAHKDIPAALEEWGYEKP